MCSLGGSSIACILLMGAAGGAVRSLVGVVKRLETAGGPPVRFGYAVFSVLVAAAAGALAGALAEGDWRLAAVAGYAGSDFLDNLCKIAIARRASGV